MYFCSMIIVTGAAGFIGSCLVSKLNDLGQINLVLVDDFSNLEKNPFTARRSTAGQAGLIDKPSDSFQNNDEEESDDYDEFYKDRSFLNTGMAAKQYEQ